MVSDVNPGICNHHDCKFICLHHSIWLVMDGKRTWVVADVVDGARYGAHKTLSPILCQLLFNRHIDPEAVQAFLSPLWEEVHDSFLFRQMPQAVEWVFVALEANETIVVHGDYDADGVCGSALLISTLSEIRDALGSTSRIESYIPHREKEGYGLSEATVKKLAEAGVKLIVTVDCGISNRPAVEEATRRAVAVIICDHHAIPSDPPTEAIIIHPGMEGETYPFRDLCGTGVAFKYASALFEAARERGLAFPVGYEKWGLDLVAIATVTDVMPMHGENRLLEHFGLTVLNKTKRPGIRALVESSGASLGSIDTTTIGFQLGPRLNAAGRMAHASYALDVLLATNEEEARVRAALLNEQNKARQSVCEKMYKEAAKKIPEPPTHKTLLTLVSDDWSPGLVGLVAGKIMEKYGLPVVAVGREGDRYIGSGRSIDGYDITEALTAAKEHLDRFGGHPQACGFSAVGKEALHQALAAMVQHANTVLPTMDSTQKLRIDAELPFEMITPKFFEQIASLAPHGPGNPVPLFVSRMLVVRKVDCLGKQKTHLKLVVESVRGTMHQAIAFRMGNLAESLPVGSLVDMVYELTLNTWRGRTEVQLRIVDLMKRT